MCVKLNKFDFGLKSQSTRMVHLMTEARNIKFEINNLINAQVSCHSSDRFSRLNLLTLYSWRWLRSGAAGVVAGTWAAAAALQREIVRHAWAFGKITLDELRSLELELQIVAKCFAEDGDEIPEVAWLRGAFSWTATVLIIDGDNCVGGSAARQRNSCGRCTRCVENFVKFVIVAGIFFF